MKKGILWAVTLCLIVLIFVGTYFLYGHLSKDYAPDIIENNSSSNISSSDSADSAGSGSGGGDEDNSEKNTAPDFKVVDINGNSVNLSDYFGKPIVLNFWASWCPPCKGEMPHFENAYKENEDIQFLMVNVTASDSMADAKSFISGEGYTFPVFYDTTGAAANTYGASSFPTTFFIDKNGNIANYAIGMLSEQSLESAINSIK